MLSARLLSLLVFVLVISITVQSQTVWERQSPDPVLTTWSGISSDPSGYLSAFIPSVLFDSTTNLYKMWFVSRSFSAACYFGFSEYDISYAVSSNGVDWFPFSKNPVLSTGTPGSFDGVNVTDPFVIHDGTQYLMYYTGFNGSTYRTGLATSLDGIMWTKSSNNPVLDVGPGSWETVGSNAPKVFKVGSNFNMLYAGFDGTHYKIGLATSSDGITWTKSSQNPILSPGPSGTWDEHSVITGALTEHDGTYYLMYIGQIMPATESVGLATSPDGMVWSKYSGNPVFVPAAPGNWDNRILYGSMIFKDSLFHYWYSGYGGSWQTGYATSAFNPLSVGDRGEGTPMLFKLFQSYPNPFNPSATIEFQLPKAQTVTVLVFNTLGEEVSRLVDGKREAGFHSIEFNAQSLPSGVYFYQFRSEEFADTKKMTLLK